MSKPGFIAVEISEREAMLWRFMMESGCFDIKGGSFEVHLDAMGFPMKLDKHEHYRLSPGKN